MNKIFLFIFIFFSILKSQDNNMFWDFSHSYILKKDQLATIVIKKEYKPTKKNEGILTFRWTLFKGGYLALLLDYEGYKNQYLLQKKYKRNTIKIALKDDYPTISKQPFAIIRFKDFKQKKAYIDVFIKDPQQNLEVRFK